MTVVGVRGIDVGGNAYEPESQIALTDSQPVVYLLAGYCTEFEKENPSYSTRFTLNRPSEALACIAQKGSSLTVPAMQAAVWMQTDSITYSRMNEKFSVTTQDWSAGQNVFQQCRATAETNLSAVP